MPRIFRGGVSLLCASVGALVAAAAAAAAPAVTWRATDDPFRLSFHVDGKPLVTEAATAGGPGGRLSYRLGDGSFHGLGPLLSATTVARGTDYRVATDERGRTALVQVRRTPTGARVTFSLQPATGVAATFEAFAATPGERYLGGGERPTPLDLSGQALAVKTAYSCQNTMPAPFFLSSAGYGISVRSTAIASLGFPGSIASSACPGGATPRCPLTDSLPVAQLCVKSATLSYDVFAGTPGQIVSSYTRTIGRPQLPPTSQFELIKWRDVVGGPGELFEDIDRLRAARIPLGWVLLDNPWESEFCYGRMTFDPKFGDPRTLIRSIHERDVKLMLWISPLVRQQFCPPTTQYSQAALFGTGGKAQTIDLTNGQARTTFETAVRTLLQLGVDGLKADRGDEIDLETEQLAGGPGVLLHNRYPLLFAQSVARAIAAAGKPDVATLFRAGAPGSSATVPGFWGGDQEGSFFGLQQAIRLGLSAGVAGYPIWGSDTGGYGETQSAEVLVRWAQFSAVSPVFEIGGIGRNSTFWDYGARTVGMVRDAAVLHYQLFPYLYELARAASATGLPILRPLALEYPLDRTAWQQDLEVLVGPNLLAVPVTSPGVGGRTIQPVYLPSGRWVDLATGEQVQGGLTPFARPTALAELPLYLRAGSAIPFAARTPRLWPRPWPTDALKLAGRAGWLYSPGDGRAFARASGYGTLRASAFGRTVTLTLRGAPKETQVLLPGATVRQVSVDGRLLRRGPLRRMPTGWAQTRAPFPGVVLKLAPRNGRADVRITLS